MKRKGFTLVELLIVIVVIGILSAMMMISSSESVSSARASAITSNLRNLQTAALAYWADNLGKFSKTNPDPPVWPDILTYVKDDEASKIDTSGYDIKPTENNSAWYIQYKFDSDRGDDARVKAKVEGRAGALGLLGNTNGTLFTSSNSDVYLRVR